jgi:RHS repeat-associated protein
VGGTEEISVTGSTTTTTKYYDAGPVQVIAVNGSFSYLVQDALGSIAIEMGSSGNLRGSQLFAPYGSQRYSTGFFDTNYGFTDQYTTSNSGLLYDRARYYDPVIGQFTSADSVQGPNRYGYVGGNPETFTDPTGHCWFLCSNPFTSPVSPAEALGVSLLLGPAAMLGTVGSVLYQQTQNHTVDWGQALSFGASAQLVASSIVLGLATGGVATALEAGGGAALADAGAMDAGAAIDASVVDTGAAVDASIADTGATVDASVGDTSTVGDTTGDTNPGDVGCANSFAGTTPVATPQGETPIASLKVGQDVTAWNPQTGKTQTEPIQAVHIHTDANLLDVTLAPVSSSQAAISTTKQQDAATKARGSQSPPSTETLHTTTEHPFLTTDRGWVDAQDLVPGEHVQQLDGSVGVVVNLQVVSGTAVRYNLTIQDVHTYAVGADLWVVHNTTCDPNLDPHGYARERAQELQNALPSRTQNSVTMGVGVARDANGILRTLIGTSEGTYFRTSVEDLLSPDDIRALGFRHAEINITDWADSSGWDLIAVAAGRQYCISCMSTLISRYGSGVLANLP